jgi:hypothetical protein
MRLARGELIALLDSDDLWDAMKLEKQVAFLRQHADYDMVITDVQRVDRVGTPIDVFRRRDFIPVDGDVLTYVLLNPALAPASALFRRIVFEQLGGFDESLRTAEDIDFHLRVAAAFKIGVIEEPLTIAARGSDGLSSIESSETDYVRVVERFVNRESGRLTPATRRAALFALYVRNARSACKSSRVTQGYRYAARALVQARSIGELANVTSTIALGSQVVAARAFRLFSSLLHKPRST